MPNDNLGYINIIDADSNIVKLTESNIDYTMESDYRCHLDCNFFINLYSYKKKSFPLQISENEFISIEINPDNIYVGERISIKKNANGEFDILIVLHEITNAILKREYKKTSRGELDDFTESEHTDYQSKPFFIIKKADEDKEIIVLNTGILKIPSIKEVVGAPTYISNLIIEKLLVAPLSFLEHYKLLSRDGYLFSTSYCQETGETIYNGGRGPK